MDQWARTLANRNADDDRSRADRHLRPAFAHRQIDELTVRVVLEWIDAMRTGTAPTSYGATKRGKRVAQLSGASMRANLNLLSRFCSWCVEREHLSMNPVRNVPTGSRPQQAAKTDTPWLDDDATVRKIVHALPSPVDLMFYLGNRSGLRLGELCGLRMSDLGFLADGVIRVRFSYDGPLKEDKHRTGRTKFVPAPVDADEMLADWLTARRHAGAQPEDLVFPVPERRKKNGDPWPRSNTAEARKQVIETEWEAVRTKLGLKVTFYEATRHSFVSRSLSAGASLDEVSAAVGHSSPIVTRRFYDHFVRKTFSAVLRAGLGMASRGGGAKVRQLRPKRARAAAT